MFAVGLDLGYRFAAGLAAGLLIALADSQVEAWDIAGLETLDGVSDTIDSSVFLLPSLGSSSFEATALCSSAGINRPLTPRTRVAACLCLDSCKYCNQHEQTWAVRVNASGAVRACSDQSPVDADLTDARFHESCAQSGEREYAQTCKIKRNGATQVNVCTPDTFI